MRYLAILPLLFLYRTEAQTVRQVGSGQTYATIGACTAAMVAGDTCNVHAGTYNENVTVSAGTSGHINTVQINGSDTVYVLSFSIGSYDKVNGFQIQNPSSPTNAPCVSVSGGATNYWVTNNTMYACNQAVLEQTSANTTFGYITGNTISYMCTTTGVAGVCRAMTINGDSHLIDSNIISHVSDGPYVFGKFNVLRNNTLGPTIDTDCDSGANSSNCHIDFMQADANVPGGADATQYLLMEGNTVKNMQVTGSGPAGSAAHAGPVLQAESCSGQCFNAILRFHTAFHIAGGGSTNDNSGTSPTLANPAWYNFKAYNNTYADVLNGNSGAGAGVNLHDYGSYGGANLNEIYYLPHNGAANQTNPYACITGHVTSGPDACTPFTYGYSDAYCAGSTPCTLYGHTYGSGAFTSDTGNISSDPLFNSYAGNDFTLKGGSPALNAGTSLTTVAAGDTGTGTSLIVNDAGFFQAIAGITGVVPDCVSVGTTGNHVCITAINYSTNTLTLANSISRSNGQSVWLYSDSGGVNRLTGSAPNMGSMGAAPTSSSWSGGVQLPQAIQ